MSTYSSFDKKYKNVVIKNSKFTLFILTILLLIFGYFSKDFRLDASSDSLLLENDQDLKYLREVNAKYGSKDFLVLTYTPKEELLKANTIKNLKNLKESLIKLNWVNDVVTILDVPLLKNNEDSLDQNMPVPNSPLLAEVLMHIQLDYLNQKIQLR